MGENKRALPQLLHCGALDNEDTKIKFENDVSKHDADFSMPESKSDIDKTLKKLQYAVSFSLFVSGFFYLF